MGVNKILMVGDIHGSIYLFKEIVHLAARKLNLDLDSEKLMVLQLGDFGYYDKSELEDVDFNFKFIDGNHEMFPDLHRDKPEQWIRRGETIELDHGITLGACGGAWSIDHAWQKAQGTWFPEEMITLEEAEEFAKTWKNKNVNLVVTHDTPNKLYPEVIRSLSTNEVPNRHALGLDIILEKVRPHLWVHGHHHIGKIYEHLWSYEERSTFRCLDFVDRHRYVDLSRAVQCCALIETEKLEQDIREPNFYCGSIKLEDLK